MLTQRLRRNKKPLLGAIALSLLATPALAEGTYMGAASTGEAVYYLGSNFQCGDLPTDDECWWRNPSVSYIIGDDEVLAIADCQTQTFKEVWVGDELVASNLTPQSRAIQLVLDNACSGN